MVIYICCHLRGVGRELIEHRGDPELRGDIFISAENASLIFDLLFGEIFALDGSLYNAPVPQVSRRSHGRRVRPAAAEGCSRRRRLPTAGGRRKGPHGWRRRIRVSTSVTREGANPTFPARPSTDNPPQTRNIELGPAPPDHLQSREVLPAVVDFDRIFAKSP